jgi:hypothetical protein
VFEYALGRLVGGALWGLGAGVAIAVARNGSDGLRDVARGAIRTYLNVADRVQETTAEMREGFEDIAAEVRAERAPHSSQSAD